MDGLLGVSAIITDSAQEREKGIAMGLARRGVDVSLCDVKKVTLEATANEIREATGQKASFVTAETIAVNGGMLVRYLSYEY